MISLRTVIIAFFSLIGVHFLATIFHWYWMIKWFDIPMHFLGGAFAALTFYWLFGRLFPHHFNLGRSFLVTLVIVLGWVSLIGVLWELMEFSIDVLFIPGRRLAAMQQQGMQDTMGDLFMDLLGGTTFALWAAFRYNRFQTRRGERHAKEETISLDNHSRA